MVCNQQEKCNDKHAVLYQLLSYSLSRCFQTLAKSVLDECFKRKSVMARVLLVRPLDLWDNKTVFDIARSAELMDFMSQTACQTKLNNIWRGKLTPLTSNLQVGKISQDFFTKFLPIPFLKHQNLNVCDTRDCEDYLRFMKIFLCFRLF